MDNEFCNAVSASRRRVAGVCIVMMVPGMVVMEVMLAHVAESIVHRTLCLGCGPADRSFRPWGKCFLREGTAAQRQSQNKEQ